MSITLIFVLGFVVSFVGVIPPGLLNMTAAKISLNEGHVRGIMFSLGAVTIVVFQTALAAIFAGYLSNHPNMVDILQRVAMVIFVLISIYYLRFANSQPSKEITTEKSSKHSIYIQGIFLSALNLFPIPFHAYMTLTLSGFGWMDFSELSIGSYVAGSVCGSFAMLYIYIFFFENYISRRLASKKNMNFIIGAITGLVALATLISIIIERK